MRLLPGKKGISMKKCFLTLTVPVFFALSAISVHAAEDPRASDTKTVAPAEKSVVETTSPAPPKKEEPAQAIKAKAEQTVKIGYVDMARVASDSAPGKAALKEVKSRTERYRSRITAKEKQLEKQKKTIESRISAMSPKEREAKAKEFQKRVDEYRKLVTKAEKDVRERQEKLLADLYKSIEESAADYGKANGLAAVVIKKDLLYSSESVEAKDLTDEIIKMVDAGRKK